MTHFVALLVLREGNRSTVIRVVAAVKIATAFK